MSTHDKTQLKQLINLDSLNLNQYLDLCILITKYYQQVINNYNNQSSQADNQPLDSFIDLENVHQDKIKQLLCIKSPKFSEPVSLRDIIFYDHLNETFCSIFQSINDMRNKRNISNRDRILVVGFIQKQLQEISQSIKEYQKSSHGQQTKRTLQNMDEVVEYQAQIQAIPKQYQSLYDLRNQMFRNREQRTRIQLIIKMREAMMKNLEKNSQFFRYQVLGAIPGSLKKQSESEILPISHMIEAYTDENWEDNFMDTLKNNIEKFKETTDKMGSFIKIKERLVPAREQLRILNQ